MAVVSADTIVGERIYTLLPHEAVVISILATNDWEVISDGFRANRALQMIIALTSQVEALEREIRFFPDYLVKKPATTTAEPLDLILHPEGVPSGTTHIAMRVQGLNATARVPFDSNTNRYRFTIPFANYRSISRSPRDILAVEITFWNALNGGTQLGEESRGTVELVDAPPASSTLPAGPDTPGLYGLRVTDATTRDFDLSLIHI